MMKKELIIFAGGIVVGASAMMVYRPASDKPTDSAPPEAFHRPAVPVASEKPANPAHEESVPAQNRKSVPLSLKPVSSNADPSPVPISDGPRPDDLYVQAIPLQYLPHRLQDALRVYPTLGDKDKRGRLADDVADMAGAGASKPEVAQALGTMFHEETGVELKTDLLDKLSDLEDPAAFRQIVQGLDPKQPDEVRVAAISALEDLGDPQAIPVLQQLLSDSDQDVREAAQDALEQLTPPSTAQ